MDGFKVAHTLTTLEIIFIYISWSSWYVNRQFVPDQQIASITGTTNGPGVGLLFNGVYLSEKSTANTRFHFLSGANFYH